MRVSSSRPPAEELVLPDGVHLEKADFSRRRFRYLSIGCGSRLVECDFSRTTITDGGLGGGHEPSEYIRCVFDGCRLSNVIPGRATFIGCSFRDVRIRTLMCHEAEFVDCVFSGLLKGVVFNGTPTSTERLGRTANAFRGNDFTDATLQDVSFRTGIDLDSQRLPTGPDYLIVRNAPELLPQVRDQVARWPEGKLRDDADTTLWVLEQERAGGQRDLFVSKTFLGKQPETMERLATLLTAVAERSDG